MMWRRWLVSGWGSQPKPGSWETAYCSPPSSDVVFYPPLWMKVAASSPSFSPAWLLPSLLEEGGQLDKHGCGSQACSGAGFGAPGSAAARWGQCPRCRWDQSHSGQTFWGRLAESKPARCCHSSQLSLTQVTIHSLPYYHASYQRLKAAATASSSWADFQQLCNRSSLTHNDKGCQGRLLLVS